MPVKKELAEFSAWTRAAGISTQTLRLRLHYLRRLADANKDQSLLELTPAQLASFLSHERWMPETRKSARGAIRAFYGWAVDVEKIARDPSRKLPSVRVPAGKPRPTPEDVFLEALLLADARGRLMLMFAGYAGLRRGEIAKVSTTDIYGECLRVVGKGGSTRMIPLHPMISNELSKVDHVGFLFPGKEDGHLSPGHVGVLMRRMLGPGWSGHTLRHRFASRAYAAERDLLAVQDLLGHSKPETTRRYVATPEGARLAAVLGV